MTAIVEVGSKCRRPRNPSKVPELPTEEATALDIMGQLAADAKVGGSLGWFVTCPFTPECKKIAIGVLFGNPIISRMKITKLNGIFIVYFYLRSPQKTVHARKSLAGFLDSVEGCTLWIKVDYASDKMITTAMRGSCILDVDGTRKVLYYNNSYKEYEHHDQFYIKPKL